MKVREEFERAFSFLAGRRMSYVQTFSGPVSRHVLVDLARFCRANETCYHEDPRAHAVLEGRREVWLRIQQHLQLSDEELWRIFNPSRPLGE